MPTPQPVETFGAYLAKNHYRPTELAELAGLSTSMVWHWVLGQAHNPFRRNVIKAAAALRLDYHLVYDMIAESFYEKHPDARPSDPEPIDELAPTG